MELQPRESVLFAEDFRAMVDWYQNVLGFEVTSIVEDDYHYCNLKNKNGIRLGIAGAGEMGVNPGDRQNNSVVLQVQVADVRGFLEYVSENGGKITSPPSLDEKDNFWFGEFADLEGNPFWIVDENCP